MVHMVIRRLIDTQFSPFSIVETRLHNGKHQEMTLIHDNLSHFRRPKIHVMCGILITQSVKCLPLEH